MSNQQNSNDLPITHYGKRGVQVPLDQALKNPELVLNTTKKTYLPEPPNQLKRPPESQEGKK